MPKNRLDLNGDGPALKVVRLRDVVPEELEWVWYRRMPRAMATLLAGDPGLGKSYLSLDIATRISKGSPWPDGSGMAPRGRVLIVSAEDHLAKIIQPRLAKLGANLDLIDYVPIEVPTGESDEYEFLDLTMHLDRIGGELQRSETVLLIVDPITSFMPGVDSNKDTEVRNLLMRISKMAELTNCTALCIKHINKTRAESNALYRVGGSIAFSGGARSVMLVGNHPEDPTTFVLAAGKSNYSEKPDSILYSIKADGTDTGVFTWGEAITLTADDMLIRASKPRESAIDKGKEFLAAYLASGPARATTVVEAAKTAGIGHSSLNKAKAELGVITKRIGPDRYWQWSLPAAALERYGRAADD